MKPILKLAAMVVGAMIATGTAHAQQGTGGQGAGAPAGPGYTAENNTVRNGGDTADADAERARQQGIDSARKREREGPSSSNRSVPAKPEEVTVGAEVRDPKGAVVGSVDSVSMGAAVIATPGGKVEVPLEAFGKNKQGLLIPMSKSDFDKAVADANKK